MSSAKFRPISLGLNVLTLLKLALFVPQSQINYEARRSRSILVPNHCTIFINVTEDGFVMVLIISHSRNICIQLVQIDIY